MGIVRSTVNIFDLTRLREEAEARLTSLEDRPIDYSDIPKSTPEELAELGRQQAEKRKRVVFSLRLQKATIAWWKRFFGEGYTRVMSRLLEEAPRNTHWIKECLQPNPEEIYLSEKSNAKPFQEP